MKKLITVCQALVIAAVISSLAYGEQIIQATEAMVGAHHATLSDTLNRGLLIQHNAEGVHTAVPYSVLTGVPTTFPFDNLTGTPTTISGYGITDAMVSDNVAITGGSITGIVDLAVVDGGTGASTSANARANLGLGGGLSTGYAYVLAGVYSFDDAATVRSRLGLGTTDNVTFGELTVTQLQTTGGDNTHFADFTNTGAPFTCDNTVGRLGTVYSDNTLNAFMYCDGIFWKPLLTESYTSTFTNKTFDANATGNALKQYKYITIGAPRVKVTSWDNSLNRYVGQFMFVNSTDEASNYADYYWVVPDDIDNTVEISARFKFQLGGADTAAHIYKIFGSSCQDSGGSGGGTGCTALTSTTLTYAGDAAGASGNVETAGGAAGAWITLTDWKTGVVPGELWVITVARDGDSDASTVNSYTHLLSIRYGSVQ